MVSNALIADCIKEIESRSLPSHGFFERPHGGYRPDSTAWAVLALLKAGGKNPAVEAGRAALAGSQMPDGRVSFSGMRSVFWPTSLAVLAWEGSGQYENAQKKAVSFLIRTTGRHWKKPAGDPVANDPSIKGWPWIEGTHSFVEPTALALLVLEKMRQTAHPRFREGLDMLVNRQLPHGGWNYGNTLVYGNELLPFPDMTGMALAALAGHAPREKIAGSILYLRNQAAGCRTPLSLAWALFGLGAWNEFPAEGVAWIEETLKRQGKFGVYGTSLLSLLALAFYCRGDFRKCAA